MPTAAHFLYIPGVLLLGVVVGWILGSRAAADAYAAELRKRRAQELTAVSVRCGGWQHREERSHGLPAFCPVVNGWRVGTIPTDLVVANAES